MTNETLKIIEKRYSCRSFTGEALKQEEMEAIGLAALQAPSAMNEQPWHIVVVKSKELIDEMDTTVMAMLSQKEDKTVYNRMMNRGGKIYYNAPCMFVVAKKPGKDLDCGIVAENIALAASAMGLGNVICGLTRLAFQTENGDSYKEKLIPEGYEFATSVLVGYATENEGTPHAIDMTKLSYIG